MAKAVSLHADDIININVGGRKFTVSRSDLLADPRSKLADMFKVWDAVVEYFHPHSSSFQPGTLRPLPTDKGGNVYLDRLVGECEALNLVELKELTLEMLQKYQRTEEQHFVTSFVQITMRDFETWQFEKEQENQNKKQKVLEENGQPTAYDAWENP